MKKGYFITIEGPEGAGKTTVINGLKNWFTEVEYDFILTREPGGIEIAEQIREVILNTQNTDMDPRTETLLYAAARRQHLIQRVIPALEAGKVVICDRFLDSSLAYQGVGRNLGLEEILNVNKFAIQETMPDLTVLLMLPPEQGLERINKNRDKSELNRLDLEKLDFHKKVFEGYRSLANRFPERIRVVDASKGVDEVIEQTLGVIKKFLIE